MEIVPLKALGPDRPGLDVPAEALALFIDLDLRGIVCSQNGGEKLRISRKDGTEPDLRDDDREKIRRWKTHLLALVVYCDDTTSN